MYERNLKEELFGCFKYIGIPFDVLDKMPIRDRYYYEMKYNEYMEARNNASKGTVTTEDISQYTSMSQVNYPQTKD